MTAMHYSHIKVLINKQAATDFFNINCMFQSRCLIDDIIHHTVCLQLTNNKQASITLNGIEHLYFLYTSHVGWVNVHFVNHERIG